MKVDGTYHAFINELPNNMPYAKCPELWWDATTQLGHWTAKDTLNGPWSRVRTKPHRTARTVCCTTLPTAHCARTALVQQCVSNASPLAGIPFPNLPVSCRSNSRSHTHIADNAFGMPVVFIKVGTLRETPAARECNGTFDFGGCDLSQPAVRTCVRVPARMPMSHSGVYNAESYQQCVHAYEYPRMWCVAPLCLFGLWLVTTRHQSPLNARDYADVCVGGGCAGALVRGCALVDGLPALINIGPDME